MSRKSRAQCGWTLGNLPRDWAAMVTLTVRTPPAFPKALKEKWLRAWAAKWGVNVQWGIIMEFTLRGHCHWHFFLEEPFVRHLLGDGQHTTEKVMRKGKETELIRGPFERWCVDTWTHIVADDSAAFARFQRGGIVELMRTPEAAARYVMKECSKRQQKQLPAGVDPQGAWWGYNKRFKPRSHGIVDVKNWPMEKFYTRIFDAADFLKREKKTPRSHTLLVTTSHNICVAKAQAAIRRNYEK